VVAGRDGPVAVLDYGKAAEPAQQAADVVKALDGQFWMDSQIRAELHSAGSVALLKKDGITQPAAQPSTAQPVSIAAQAGSGSSAESSNQAGRARVECAGSGGAVYQDMSNDLKGAKAGNSVNGAPSNGDAGPSSSYKRPSAGDSNSLKKWSEGIQASSSKNAVFSNGNAQVNPETPSQVQPAASANTHEREASMPISGGVSWGFDSALGLQLFLPNDAVALEDQYLCLQKLDIANQALDDDR